MSLVLIVVIIEKAEDIYTAYSPNLLGVGVTAGSREEVERQMRESIERYIKDLGTQHESAGQRITLATGQLDEVIQCVHETPRELFGGRTELHRCELRASKEGLCTTHWRKLYGHAVSPRRSNVCEVCGETDVRVLKTWQVPCPGKAADPNWLAPIEERRARDAEQRRREKWEERVRRAEESTLLRPPRTRKSYTPSPHDPLTRAQFRERAGLSEAELAKLLRRGEVDGLLLGGRMYFSRRQLEKLVGRKG
jgi:predicted RNase H-like HicB family nuclease